MAEAMTEQPRQFSIVLRADKGVTDAERRLAMVLRYALRAHGLRCLLCAPEPAGSSPSLPEPDTEHRRHVATGNLPLRRR